MITVISHERHGISDHQHCICLFNSFFRLTRNKMKGIHYWPFVREIHQWLVDSPHKGPVTWKALPCNDIIMYGTFQCHGLICLSGVNSQEIDTSFAAISVCGTANIWWRNAQINTLSNTFSHSSWYKIKQGKIFMCMYIHMYSYTSL